MCASDGTGAPAAATALARATRALILDRDDITRMIEGIPDHDGGARLYKRILVSSARCYVLSSGAWVVLAEAGWEHEARGRRNSSVKAGKGVAIAQFQQNIGPVGKADFDTSFSKHCMPPEELDAAMVSWKKHDIFSWECAAVVPLPAPVEVPYANQRGRCAVAAQ